MPVVVLGRLHQPSVSRLVSHTSAGPAGKPSQMVALDHARRRRRRCRRRPDIA